MSNQNPNQQPQQQQQQQQQQNNPFGVPPQNSGTTGGLFGSGTTQGFAFGANQQPNPAFGTVTFGSSITPAVPMFGQPSAGTNTFSAPASQTGAFGTTNTGSTFGAPLASNVGGFGFNPAGTNSGFGATQPAPQVTNTFNAPSASGFGSGFGATTSSTNFGAPTTSNPTSSAFAGSTGRPPVSAFGPGTTTSTGAFGTSSTSAPPSTFSFGGASTGVNAPNSFGQSANAPVTGTFGGFNNSAVPNQSVVPAFGATSTTQPSNTFGTNNSAFGTTSAPAFGGAPSTISTTTNNFGATMTNQPTTAFGAGAPVPTFGAGFGTTTAPTTSTASVAAPQAPSAPTSGMFTFGASKPADAGGFSFGAASTAVPETTIAKPLFGATPAAPANLSAEPPKTTFSSKVAPTQPATDLAKPSFSFTAPTAIAPSEHKQQSAAPTVTFKPPEAAPAPTKPTESVINPPNAKEGSKTADEKSMASSSAPLATPGALPLEKLPAVVSFPSNLKNKTLEEIIMSWNEELEGLVSSFERQAVEIARWDKVIVHNGEQIIALNERVNKLEGVQKEIDQSLSYVVAQQSEFEGLLDGIERELPSLVQAATGGKTSVVDAERERMYVAAEAAQTQVIDIANQVSRMIYEINTVATEPTVPSSEEGQPLVEVTQILNAHLDALQWIDHKVEELRKASTAVKNQSAKVSLEVERFSNSSSH